MNTTKTLSQILIATRSFERYVILNTIKTFRCNKDTLTKFERYVILNTSKTDFHGTEQDHKFESYVILNIKFLSIIPTFLYIFLIACTDDKETVFPLLTNKELQKGLEMSQDLHQLLPSSDLLNRILMFEVPYIFDFYMKYLEINRKPHEFYLPRLFRLKECVDLQQDLVDERLDKLGLAIQRLFNQ